MAGSRSDDWLKVYAALEAIGDPAWSRVLRCVQHLHLPAGAHVFRDGDPCQYYLLVVEGSVLVRKTTPDGHEIVLYHVNAGGTCELTTVCMLGGKRYAADAVAVTPAHVVLIPKDEFQSAVKESPAFRHFVYSSLDKGVGDLVSLVETVAFGHIDQRLARYLLGCPGARGRIQATHQDIAHELGTAREVVSRALKHFEHNGWVRLHRGWIEVVDEMALRALLDRQV
ncbi:MAG: Crp/Fnr family transcriptional regulator [Gammaproteobacteria bacterium]|nr:Crp/Fnr family transcriptional regulator [Gammaproteobacteria bacterium]